MNIQTATDIAVLHHALVGVAEEMGEALKRAAYSPNIKERRDYSCALFDAKGRLLAQAAHLPVHLGSMPASVQAIISSVNLGSGDFGIVNDPYSGGTHLPDVTVVAPVFSGRRLIGYVANRAHHADFGGAAPGSMSPQPDLFGEGFVIPPTRVDQPLLTLLRANTRSPEERIGDLNAQFASCRRGAARFLEIESSIGQRRLPALCARLFDHSRDLIRDGTRHWKRGYFVGVEFLEPADEGMQAIYIPLQVHVQDDRLTFDFRGADEQVPNSMNAVKAVTESAVVYSVLCMCDPTPPVNQGCFEHIQVITELGTVVDSNRPAPVAGGNVETSQRIVDLCLGALAGALPGRVPAQSQGTMNNLTIGGIAPNGEQFTYYETIAGGCGAGPIRDGASATHSHMTNTLNTPVEALEHAYPLRVEEYALREGSGGMGKHRGGDGVVRRVRTLVPAQFGLLTERREHAPKSVGKGKAGRQGINQVRTGEGEADVLPAKYSGELEPGDALEIRTPGGGGWK